MEIFNLSISELLFRIKLVSFILSAIFFILAVYFVTKFRELIGVKTKAMLASFKALEPASGGASQSKWEEVERHFNSDREAEWKFAIIEADKLVDSLLRSAGYLGDTMGERLMNIEKGQLLSLEGLWEAHKIRNKLAHDSNYFLRYAEARRTIELYKKALEELGIVN